jgi:2-dehydro-3-deoxygalactonokinase
MAARQGFITVDWGTTNRRIYVVSAAGAIEERIKDDLGVLSVPSGGFGAMIADLRARFGQRPLILAGMVGSNRGWVETPYIPCPSDVHALVAGLKRLGDGSIAIVPGVCHISGDHADVMRGEELQILGALAAGLIPGDAPVCHPGTHAKWINLHGSHIAAFRTVMTGEIFRVLSEHSILADLIHADVRPDNAFVAGVRHGLHHDDLSAELFSIRARVLLGRMESAAAPSYASGLLIGNDIKIGLSFTKAADDVTLIGEPNLTALYAAALRTAGMDTRQIDGEEAFLAGAKRIAEEIAWDET